MMATAILSSACSQSPEQHLFLPTDARGWYRHDSLNFSLPPAEGDTIRSFEIEVRINRRYAYQDLWLVVEQHPAKTAIRGSRPTSTSDTHPDTLRLKLTDADGNFLGQGRDLLTYAQALTHPIRLSTTDTTRITITHIMDDATIQGVSDVGIHCKP